MSKSKTYRVLGLMSGSSLDGLDLAFCQFSLKDGVIQDWQLREGRTVPFSEQWQARLAHLPLQDGLTCSKTHTYFGHYTGELTNQFINELAIEPDFIASHGHTIYHYPDKRHTLQIGDGAALAAVTGYPVICDFRTMDVALDGEGAPLAPLVDKILFKDFDFYLNLGGIANISCKAGDRFIAFDIAAANQMLNALAGQLHLEYDEGGKIAAGGEILPELLQELESLPYLKLNYPKSLGNQWVSETVIPLFFTGDDNWPDKLRTACQHLASQIVDALTRIVQQEQLKKEEFTLFVTGGGAFNHFLMDTLDNLCRQQLKVKIIVPEPSIVQFKEAILISLMGVFRVENIPNCLSSVTGAKFDNIGGAIYQGWRKLI